jgi:hypothetical protein
MKINNKKMPAANEQFGLTITTEYHVQLTEQWKKFIAGKTIKVITVKK